MCDTEDSHIKGESPAKVISFNAYNALISLNFTPSIEGMWLYCGRDMANRTLKVGFVFPVSQTTSIPDFIESVHSIEGRTKFQLAQCIDKGAPYYLIENCQDAVHVISRLKRQLNFMWDHRN